MVALPLAWLLAIGVSQKNAPIRIVINTRYLDFIRCSSHAGLRCRVIQRPSSQTNRSHARTAFTLLVTWDTFRIPQHLTRRCIVDAVHALCMIAGRIHARIKRNLESTWWRKTEPRQGVPRWMEGEKGVVK